jgi:DNA recombination protein RmuC
VTENATAIQEAGRRIYEKLVVAQGHVTKLGNALGKSVDYYNSFLGTIEGKDGVFYHGRQLGELASSKEELLDTSKLQVEIREMKSPEWSQPGLALAAGADESEKEDL